MTQFESLIQQLCPNGVRWVKLGECCQFNRGSVITAKDAVAGDVPVIAGGQKPAYYHNYANRTGETITIAGSGAYAGYVSYWNIPIFVSDAFTIEFNKGLGIPKYLYYNLKNQQEKIHATKKGSGVPHVHPSSINTFLIPLPPLPIQEKIVEILDKFSLLSAELEAELEGRRKQYEYYRTRLLSFDANADSDTVVWKTLGEVGTFDRGNGMSKSDFSEEGTGCIHYGQIYTRLKTFTYETLTKVPNDLAKRLTKVNTGDLIIACTSENVEDVCKAVAWLGNETIVIGGHAAVYHHSLNPKYVAYYFQTEKFAEQKRKYAKGVKVIDIKISELEKILIPIPPLAEQERIVAILDKFEALVTDLSQGLPAEIQKVQQQYEYYRNLLLNFEK